MALRVSDLQTVSDLDSIRTSSDVFKRKQFIVLSETENNLVWSFNSHKTSKVKFMSGPKHPAQVSEPIKC